MFKRVDHVELVTAQPEPTIEFYTEILGFKVRSRDRIERAGAGAPIDLVYLELGGTPVELITYGGMTIALAPSGIHLGYNLIALEVEDVARAIAFLETKNVAVVWGPRTAAHYARAEILDPNGYHVELHHWF